MPPPSAMRVATGSTTVTIGTPSNVRARACSNAHERAQTLDDESSLPLIQKSDAALQHPQIALRIQGC